MLELCDYSCNIHNWIYYRKKPIWIILSVFSQVFLSEVLNTHFKKKQTKSLWFDDRIYVFLGGILYFICPVMSHLTLFFCFIMILFNPTLELTNSRAELSECSLNSAHFWFLFSCPFKFGVLELFNLASVNSNSKNYCSRWKNLFFCSPVTMGSIFYAKNYTQPCILIHLNKIKWLESKLLLVDLVS